MEADVVVAKFLGLMAILFTVGLPDISGQQQPQVPPNIRIGALFDPETDLPVEAAFKHAVNMVNDDRATLIRSTLMGVVDTVEQADSFKASRKMCQMMQSGTGIVAMFGPQTASTATHIQSISDNYHIPHVETRFDYKHMQRPYSINIHPKPSVLGQAFANFLEAFGWESFVVVYQDEESLVRMQEMLKYPKRHGNIKITFRQIDPMSDDIRPMLKKIQKSADTKIVLDCNFEYIEEILNQANEIGIINDYYAYFITSLDLERIDLSPYKASSVNITGFRLTDTTSPQVHQYLKKWSYSGGTGRGREHPLFSDNVLMYDAVRVLAKSLDDLSRMDGFGVSQMNCRQEQKWRDGFKIVDYIRRVEFHGLSGEITFDEQGFRTNFRLELMEKRRDNMVKSAIWEPAMGLNFTLTQAEIEEIEVEKLQNKTLRITTAFNDPFVMKRPHPDVPPEAYDRLSFEEKYEGYVLDFVYELSQKLKFKYKFHIVGDGKYGGQDEVTGEWNGMIRELQDQKADLAVIDLSITSARQKAVDFSMPYMSTGVGILYKKRKPPPPNLFSFLSPLSIDVWIYMSTLYLTISILMFLLARVTPHEWDNPHPCKSDPDELETLFSVGNALWFGMSSFLCQGCDILPKLTPFEWESPHPCLSEPTELENLLTLHNCFWHNWGSIMQQGSDIAPTAISTRMVAGMWWFFTLIMISSYTANLAAFLTAAQMDVPVNSADDLAKQTKIKYGTYCCGSSNAFFKGSTIPTYQKLNAFMESAKPSVYTSGNKEGIDRVLKEDGAYAFFMEGAAIEYNVERQCELTQIGGLLDSKGYGVALPPGSPYTATITQGILALQEDGVLQKLKIKWWKEHGTAGQCGGDEEASAQLGLANLGGVFIVLMGGMITSCIIAVVEYLWGKRMLIHDENQENIWHAMWNDFKFACDFRAGDSKPVEDKPESKSGSKSLLNEESHYGEVGGAGGEETGAGGGKKSSRNGAGNNDDSAYAVFNDSFSQKSKSKG